jgi:hypothetical protein
MRDLFLLSPWPGTIAWAVIYISDYVLTITCARLYRRNLASKIVFQGSFELNPIFQRDVDSLKIVSPRFLLFLSIDLDSNRHILAGYRAISLGVLHIPAWCGNLS